LSKKHHSALAKKHPPRRIGRRLRRDGLGRFRIAPILDLAGGNIDVSRGRFSPLGPVGMLIYLTVFRSCSAIDATVPSTLI
jgi:hypothetical protein